METISCNLCGSADLEFLYSASDWLLEKPDIKSTFVRCTKCGLIFQNPRPKIDEIGKYYTEEYDMYHVDDEIKKSSTIMKHIMQYGIYKRKRIVLRVRSTGTLLDVGCATGIFIDEMSREKGWTVTGIELNSEAARFGREKKGLNIIPGTLEDARFPANSFDVVTLWDVLEHLHDPTKSLEEIARILKPGGNLIFRVPNGNSIDAKLFGSHWAGLEPPRHLYIFDQSTINKYMEKTGFQLIRSSCEIGSYPTFVLSMKFWLISKNVNKDLRDFIIKLFYSPLARGISTFPFFLISLFKKGSLLTVTAVKQQG